MNQQIRKYVFLLSAAFVLGGAALFISKWIYAAYVFAVGAAGVTVCFLTSPYEGLSIRRRRLHRLNVISGILIIVSSIFMFRGRKEWVIFLLIAALFLVYTSSVNPRADE
jgi:hypothetical protein